MADRPTCPECGVDLDPGSSPLGQCPACLFRLAFGVGRDVEPGSIAPDPSRLSAGHRISRYRIVEPLGAGGMGVVYRAVDEQLDRDVAIKLVSPSGAAAPAATARFLREARAAAALDHPNVCGILDVGEDTELGPFLVMPFYAGETLDRRLERGPLGLSEAVELVVGLVAGLTAAHEAGIVHRDLKPSNLLLTPDGPKILDFGLARPAGDPTLTGTGATLGTLAYMAPEQVRGERVDPRTDLWSLGVVLYEALTGRRPFEGERPATVLHAILHREPEPPGLDPALDRLLLACLARDPGDRPSRATEILEAFAAVAPLPGDASDPLRPPTAVAPGGHREGFGPLVVGSLLAAIVVGSLVAAAIAPGLRSSDLGRPPLALAGVAAALLEEHEVPEPVDEAFGIERVPAAPGPPGGEGLVFWYRQSPTSLAPVGLPLKAADLGRTRPRDPPPAPGAARVVLDPAGRLLELRIAGRDSEGPEVGIDRLGATPSHRLFGFDARVMAWVLPVGFLVALLAARSSLRRGVADRRGAGVVAATVFGALFLSWVIGGGHGATAVDELRLLIGAAGLALVYAVLAAALSAAVGPWGRRQAWSRLVRGRLGDPAVGRDVLVGLAAGVAWTLARSLAALAPAGVAWPLDPPHERFFLGGRYLVGEVLNSLTVSLLVGLAVAVALAGLEALFGRPRLAAGVVLALGVPALALGEASPLAWPFALLVAATGVGLVRRWGILVLVTAGFVTRLLWLAPLTLDLDAWTAPISAGVLGLVGGVAVMAAAATLGRRSAVGPLHRRRGG